jgi:hypothetical protein
MREQSIFSPRTLAILFLRCALYSAVLALLLWNWYGFSWLIEVGRLTRTEGIGQVATMTSCMVFIALLVWVFTWKFQENYGAAITALICALLNGVALILFMFFVLGTVPVIAWHTREFFSEEDLSLFFVVIPSGTLISMFAHLLTIPLLPKRTIDSPQASWDDRPTLKL